MAKEISTELGCGVYIAINGLKIEFFLPQSLLVTSYRILRSEQLGLKKQFMASIKAHKKVNLIFTDPWKVKMAFMMTKWKQNK